MANGVKRHWEKWGKENPFFGVLSQPMFLNANLNEQSREEFFLSGERHVDHVYQVIQAKVRNDFRPGRVLDFGCGVGRLLIPFARRAQTVVGIDLSRSMLDQAATNCKERGLKSVELLDLAGFDRLDPNSFDLVHSYIVFQHIPVSEGERLLRKLLDLIAIGGIGVIHLTFSNVKSRTRNAISALRARSKLVHGLVNLAQGSSFSWPLMQMNGYSMNRVFDSLFAFRCSGLHAEFEDHQGIRSAILYFEKNGAQALYASNRISV